MPPTSTGERLETFVFNDSTIEHLHRYAIAKELSKGKVVLDIACGEGYGSNLLAEEAQFVQGVDIDRPSIEKASLKYQRNNLRFTAGPVEKIPFETASFDIVTSFETLEHTSQHETMLAEIKRVLKPGGVLIISTPDRKNYADIPNYKNPFHKKELYRDEFVSLLKKGFKHCRLYLQNLFTASILLDTSDLRFQLFDGDYQKVNEIKDIEPMYFLAICSDGDIPVLHSSIFTGRGTLETALLQKEEGLKSTVTYRLGHFLLWPLKLLRKLFTKKTIIS